MGRRRLPNRLAPVSTCRSAQRFEAIRRSRVRATCCHPAPPVPSAPVTSSVPRFSWRAAAIAVYAAGVLLLLLQMVDRADRPSRVWSGVPTRSRISTGAGCCASRRQASASMARYVCSAAASRRCRWRSASERAPSFFPRSPTPGPRIGAGRCCSTSWPMSRRHDCLSQAIAALTCAVYWVHPGRRGGWPAVFASSASSPATTASSRRARRLATTPATFSSSRIHWADTGLRRWS